MLHKTFVTVGVLALATAPPLAPIAAAQPDAITICVTLSRSEIGPELAAPLRDAVVNGLLAAHGKAIALDAGDDGSGMMEAAQKGCAYVLYTRVQSRTGGGGLMGRMNNLMPKGGTPKMADAPPPSGSPTAPVSLPDAEKAVVKSGETITVEYRLLEHGVKVAATGKVEGRAQTNGDDVLGPMMPVLAAKVLSSSTGSSSNDRRGGGGTGGRGSRTTTQNAAPQPIDCAQMAAASHGTITVEACNQMVGAQQAFDKAASDPSASRLGDDKLSCDQIAAEIKQQPFTTPDKAKVAEAQAATADLTQTLEKQQKEVTAMVTKETAEMAAATRFVPTNAAGAAAAEKIEAEQKAANERMAAESKPKTERTINATTDIAGDVGTQVSENPRLAKLYQLAMQKNCKLQ